MGVIKRAKGVLTLARHMLGKTMESCVDRNGIRGLALLCKSFGDLILTGQGAAHGAEGWIEVLIDHYL